MSDEIKFEGLIYLTSKITAEVDSGNLGSYIGAESLKPFINSDLILGELIEFSIPGTHKDMHELRQKVA